MRTARTSLIISLLSVVVTGMSFLNQLVIARTFGASSELDTYLQATSLPLLVSGLFISLFAYSMIPALMRATIGATRPEHPTTAFLLAIGSAGLTVGLIGAATAPWTLRLVTAGRGSNPESAAMLNMARIAWLGAGASVVVGFIGAVLNSRSRFVLPVVLSMLPYLGTICVVLVAGSRFGAMALVWGLTGGTVISGVALVATAWRSFSFRGVAREHFAHVRTFVLNAPLALLSALTFAIFQSVDAFWAPRLGPSNLSVLGYCQRMLIAVAAVMAAGPSVVLQPRLSAAAAANDDDRFIADLGRGLRLTILICAPAAVGLSVLARPIVRLAFERGAFTHQATLAVAQLLPWMLAGMVPMVVTVMLFKALYAKADRRTAAILGIGGPILYFAGSGALMTGFGLTGIGIAYLATWLCVAATGMTLVSERGPGVLLDSRFLRDLGALLLSAAVPAYLSRYALFSDWEQRSAIGLAVRLAGAAVAGVGSYLAVGLFAARVDDLRLLVQGLRARA